MTKLGVIVSTSAVASFVVFGVMSAATAAPDLSRYRDFHLGTKLPTVAKQIGASPSEVKDIQRRPALIQELQWRPRPLGPTSKTEPAQEVVFTFYEGELFRIEVNYDRYETEGLTTADIVGAISATYGMAATPPAPINAVQGTYGDQEEVLARWEDPQYRFDLIRSSYGPTFKLVGLLKNLEAPAQTAILEAKRLDDQEAPQRDAARLASEEDAARTRLEKARVVNKPKFRL
jgi:hypothetical protein